MLCLYGYQDAFGCRIPASNLQVYSLLCLQNWALSLTVPIAFLGLTLKESASVAMVGGADGPMVLFTSLALAKHLFVPITVVAYLYLGLTYGGYPYLVKTVGSQTFPFY